MKRILIISHHLPPRPTVGSVRIGGLVKYLPRFGWEPVVLTTDMPPHPVGYTRIIMTPFHKDFSYWIKKIFRLSPAKRLDEQAKPIVIKFDRDSWFPKFIEFIYGLINYPDELKGWIPFAVNQGEKILRQERMDAILSSSHPVTAHLIAHKLRKSFNIPWLADLRDLWTQNHYYQYGALRKWFEKKLEIKTLSNAAALVTVSGPLANELKKLHASPAHTILNGFDPAESKPIPLTKDFTITYTGRFYDGKRDPLMFFEAIQQLITTGELNPAQLKIRFWGSKNYWLDQEIKKFKMEAYANQFGMLPRDEILSRQRESQILLLLTWNNPKEEGVYTGKLFEYLGARRPILALGPKGVVSELLEETRAGILVSNLLECKKAIRKFSDEFHATGQVSYSGQESELNKYSHIEMARKFAEVLNQISP